MGKKKEIANLIINQMTKYQFFDKFEENAKQPNKRKLSVEYFRNIEDQSKLMKSYSRLNSKRKYFEIYFIVDYIDKDSLYLAILDCQNNNIIYSKVVHTDATEYEIIEIGNALNKSIDSYMMLFEIFSKKKIKSVNIPDSEK